MDNNDIQSTLALLPDWPTLNAYTMTKHCCAELTKRGQKLPNWTVIRDIIGRGSATDIERGKRDFRREHGDALRKMSGFVKGVPEILAPHILGFWTAAITLVREEFDGQVAQWQTQIEQAEAAVAHADSEREQAASRADILQAQTVGLQEAITTLRGQIDTERATREQAERMFELNRQELADQRDRLLAALESSRQELDKALTRLEGVERHALLEIDRARTEAKSAIANTEAKAKRDANELILAEARYNKQFHDLREQLANATRKTAAQEQENAAMRERLQRAEAQVDHLSSENARLVGVLKRPAGQAKGLLKKRNITKRS